MGKCIVKGCRNHKYEGRFVGDLCAPCHTMITTGNLNPSYAWFGKEIESLRQQLAECQKDAARYHEIRRQNIASVNEDREPWEQLCTEKLFDKIFDEEIAVIGEQHGKD